MTIYAVFPDARKGNRIICMYSSYTLYEKKVKSILKLKIRSRKDGLYPA